VKALTLALALVAGVAAAQPATMNCRSSAANCNAAAFKSAGTGPYVVDLTSSTSASAIQFQNGAGVNFSFSDTDSYIIRSASNTLRMGGGVNSQLRVGAVTFSTPSGNDAIAVTASGAWTHLGGGTNDRFKSDGTNILVDTNLMSNSTDTVDVGGTAAYWRTVYTSRGVSLGEGAAVKWTGPPVSDNTTRSGQLVYNADAKEPVYASVSRKYNPVGQAKEWVVEKRTMVADVGFESTTCPTANPGLRGTGAGAVTYACTDAAAATNVTVSGESYRQSVTTTTANTVSIVDVSAATAKLELGPKLLQRVSIPASSNANVRIWVALVPIATSLTGVDTGAISVIGFRFSTAVPDTNWQACSGDGASVACTDTTIAPTTGTNLVLEIDCRETTSCRFLINGSLVATRSATLPTSTTQLGQRVLVQTLTTTAKTLGFGRQALQVN